jgi:arsenate reductase
MKKVIKEFCEAKAKEFHLISDKRKSILVKIAAYINYKEAEPVNLLFVCTHNSRRSTFGQVWAKTAAHFYGITNVETYSGGTEVTAFHPNAINALLLTGFDMSEKGDPSNPKITMIFDKEENAAICFSKVFDDEANPKSNFGALMTCGHADENCPFIAGAELRIPLTYVDPKVSDGTPQMVETYKEISTEIAREMLYLFSLCKKN